MIVLPQVGQIIRLSPVTLVEDKSNEVYKSRVADMDIAKGIAAIELPINEETGRSSGRFETGTEWHIWYVGTDGSRYDFKTKIQGKRTENIPLILLHIPEKDKITRTQRRGYLRVNLSVDIAVKAENAAGEHHFLAKTVDVSGGGLAFVCPSYCKLFPKDQLRIWISLPLKAGPVLHAMADAEIIRIKELRSGQLSISVKFLDIHESDRAKIVRACYEKQLELRKKGINE
ncbi:flagellar brake protein [Brevibacillus dissolubilis]|uniref:flagellar brake protein n=1 Tax=Brevibacillus dissolubilis TaxID=1844116 RepID=UPI0020FFFD8F|nr:flagellar brake domain-containing protein [Brevibacillus dissolubilis]